MSESDALIGVLLDNQYQIVELLGKGGMASVYKATQKSINRNVAVKVLPRSFLHDDTFMQRFQQEAELIARLEHFHILPIYAYGDYDGMPYIVMRYMGGGTLSQLIERGPLPWDEIARMTGQIGGALDYAHSRNVIHRDIKPSNVLLDSEGNGYLADFGIARMAETTAHLTGSGIIGTPAYMAPEQSRPGPPTLSVDIYAMGVTVFEMITGSQPYRADTPIAQILMHVQSPIPALRAYNPSIPDGVQAVIDRAMAKEPEERFATARELAQALEAAIQHGGGWSTDATIIDAPRGAPVAPYAPTYEGPKQAPATNVAGARPGTVSPTLAPPRAGRKISPVLLIGGALVGLAVVAGVVALVLLGALGGFGQAEPPAAADEVAAVTTPESQEVAIASDPTATATATEEPPAEEPPAEQPTPTVEPSPTPLADRTTLRGVTMLLVAAGPFIMGNDAGYPRERPAREVYLSDFYMDETEVTNLYYMGCVDDGACQPPEFIDSPYQVAYYGYETFHNNPVIYINWEEAQTYCRWRGGHLPTEAQWEKAARWNPETGQAYLFPWGGVSLDQYYLNHASLFGHTTDVNFYPQGRSPYGMYDMAGNLAEWIFDWYQDNYYEVSPVENPTGPATGQFRVLRGGSYESRGSGLMTTFRDYLDPRMKQATVGFRCAYTPSGGPTEGQ